MLALFLLGIGIIFHNDVSNFYVNSTFLILPQK